jgi:hypothetical protein
VGIEKGDSLVFEDVDDAQNGQDSFNS